MLLEVKHLSVHYGAVVAVDHVSLDVEPGRITGLIGANGAGKTSLIDAVTGFTPAATGSVQLRGDQILGWPAHRRANAGLRRTFQNLRLFDDLTVRENLSVAESVTRGIGGLRSLGGRSVPQKHVDEVAELVGITDVLGELPKHLPAGTRRLVDLGRAIAARPSVLLLDEPAAGLDTSETEKLGTRLRNLCSTELGLLLVEHDTSLVFALSDYVVAIDFGKTISTGGPDEVREDPAVLAAYLGAATEEEGT